MALSQRRIVFRVFMKSFGVLTFRLLRINEPKRRRLLVAVLGTPSHKRDDAPNDQVGEKNENRTCAESNEKGESATRCAREGKCAKARADYKDKNYAL